MKWQAFFLSMICAGTLIILLIGFFAVSPALAQEETPPPEECQCRQCHEEQYYLYDTGKWYCLCKAPMTCVHCHGGNGLETNADLAHKEMLANPFSNHAAVCQECHKEESQAHVNEFVALAGAGSMPVSLESQPAFRTAAPQPFPKSAPRAFGFWGWFSVMSLGIVLALLTVAYLRR